MKLIKLALLVLAMFWVTLAMVGLTPGVSWGATAGSGIAGTDHDFSGGATPVGLCTFCHTPHRALSTMLLWNHTLSTNTFKWDETKTTAGTNYPSFKGDTYKGPTAKCLSCHDGSVAVGDIAWWKGGKPAILDNTKHGAGDANNVGLGGAMAGNHPVAMPYPYLGAGNTYNSSTTGSAIASAEWVGDPATNGIRLFNDDGTGAITAGAVAGKTGIECSSCHDPHNSASVKDVYFLRGTLAGSTGGAGGYICLLCHKK